MTKEVDDVREFAVLSGMASTAMIETEDGPLPLDWIACGDRVLTRDSGFQVVRWISRTQLDISFLHKYPEVCPVTVTAGAFGPQSPEYDLVMSPSQLVPLRRSDGSEVLVSADVVGEPIYPSLRPQTERFTYMNVLLDSHSLVRVDGAWVGSLFTADLGSDDETLGVMEPFAPILDRAAALGLWRVLSLQQPRRRA